MNLTITTIDKKPLLGTRLILEKSSLCHAEFLKKCYDNDDFMDCYRLAQPRDNSIEQVGDLLHREQSIVPQNMRRLEWVIRKQSTTDEKKGKLIGIASLADYQLAHNRAELLVGILQSEDRTSGFSLEATLLVLEFAFHHAKLHKLISFVYSFNKKAQKNTLHLGFHQEALLRDHYFNHRSGKFIDLYQNGLLKDEFFSSKQLSRWSKRLLDRDITENKKQNIEVMSKSQLNDNFEKVLKQRLKKKQA